MAKLIDIMARATSAKINAPLAIRLILWNESLMEEETAA